MAVVTAMFGWQQGSYAALAAGFGVGISVVNTLILRWHMRRAAKMGAGTSQQNFTLLMRCALERLLATGTLFALAIALLHLLPLPLLLGFVIGLAAQFTTGFQNVGLK